MVLLDVNVIVYAYRKDATDHRKYRGWLESVVNGDEAYGLSNLVLSGFLRIVTHPKVFHPPSPVEDALGYVAQIHGQSHRVSVEPGPRHWEIFTNLCRTTKAKGNFVPDAFFAAMAIESGCEWITTDRGFSRYPGLRWRHPFGS